MNHSKALRFVSLVIAYFLVNPASKALDIDHFGYWLEPETKIRVLLYPCAANVKLLCGRIIDVPATQPDKDVNNPQKSLRSRQLRDLELMQDFQPVAENVWEGGGEYGKLPGRIYLPANGDTLGDHKNRYRVAIEGDLLSISVANCRLISCFTKSEWQRVEESGRTQEPDPEPPRQNESSLMM